MCLVQQTSVLIFYETLSLRLCICCTSVLVHQVVVVVVNSNLVTYIYPRALWILIHLFVCVYLVSEISYVIVSCWHSRPQRPRSPRVRSQWHPSLCQQARAGVLAGHSSQLKPPCAIWISVHWCLWGMLWRGRLTTATIWWWSTYASMKCLMSWQWHSTIGSRRGYVCFPFDQLDCF